MHEWESFFLAETGAAAALEGLLFVSISINVREISAQPHLPLRAGEAIILLGLVLAVSSVGLIPTQDPAAFGAEVSGLAAFALGWELWAALRGSHLEERTNPAPAWIRALRLGISLTPPGLFLLGGASLAAGSSWGTGPIVAATLLCFAVAVFGSWVLLVEVHRSPDR